jgi:hypothetical protein
MISALQWVRPSDVALRAVRSPSAAPHALGVLCERRFPAGL